MSTTRNDLTHGSVVALLARVTKLEDEINQLTTENEELRAECEQLKAALKEEKDRYDEEYISLEEAYLQCQKDLYDESEQLNALRAKLEGGVRVKAQLDEDKDYFADNWSFPFNATLILDDGVKI